jgi:hypothetical protein
MPPEEPEAIGIRDEGFHGVPWLFTGNRTHDMQLGKLPFYH